MTDRNSDRDAFQPVGEGTLVPDPALDHPADGRPTRQREAAGRTAKYAHWTAILADTGALSPSHEGR